MAAYLKCLSVLPVALAAFLISATSLAEASQESVLSGSGSEIAVSDLRLREIHKVLGSRFSEYRVYSLETGRIAHGLARSRGRSRLVLQLDATRTWDMHLEPADPRSPSYKLSTITKAGIRELPRSRSISYKGHMAGTAGQVRLSIADGWIAGYVTERSSELFIEPVREFFPSATRDLFVVYRGTDVKESSVCLYDLVAASAGPDTNPAHDSTALPKVAQGTAEPCKVAQIVFAADYSMIKNYGTVEAVEDRIVTVFNVVNGWYEDPRINMLHEIVEFHIETEDLDTWGTGLDFSGNLSRLNSWSRSGSGFKQTFDVCGLWWYLPGGGTIGMAGIGTICSSSRPGHIIRDYTKSLKSQAIDQAHELGHNWGANHVSGPADIMYPRVTGSNTGWTQTTVTAITRHKSSRTCIDGCSQPPLADFSLRDSTGCRGTVAFGDKSRHGPRSWNWEFGDGKFSDEQNPVHSYLSNGTFTIRLIVANDFGADTAVKTGYVVVNAPLPPTVSGKQMCAGGAVTLSATAPSGLLVKWYDRQLGGSPLYIGSSYTTPVLTSKKVFFVETGAREFALQRVGPADTSVGDGAYKEDAGHIWMRFRALRNCRLQSIVVFSNRSGQRHFLLTTNNLSTTVAEKIEQVGVEEKTVLLDWDLQGGKTYEMVLENTATGESDTAEGSRTYYNNLFRTRAGVSYPQTIDGLISVTSNYWRQQEPSSTGWYIGYNWQVQEVDICASGRVAVTADPACTAAISSHTNAHGYQMKIAGRQLRVKGDISAPRESISIFDLNGRCIMRGHLDRSMQKIEIPAKVTGTVVVRIGSEQDHTVERMFVVQ